ncbi:toprim domain-containing protein [Sphingopyxis sp. P1IMeth2]|uniref:DUF7146 domain-containing protein n=1 Tax=Sphingopyxis sp. P1IMeth2 TaxID=1892848 RepID=UPI0016443F3A|nr:toprim domain-containing protein [Sphingopyxis sp. P1IMeth2]
MNPNRDPVLQSAAINLVEALGGLWRDGGAMCRCPAHDDASPSLSVRIGERSLLFKCFAGCPTAEILRAIRRLHLDIPSTAPTHALRPIGAPSSTTALARRIWDAGDPLWGTAGDRYLRSRALEIRTSALRYNPHTPLGRGTSVRFRPAIIAPIVEASRLVAIQRIFLDPTTATLAADLEKPKLTLGRPLAGAVRLSPARTVLGLAEGIETALSAMVLLGIPVWATLGTERLSRIGLPDAIEHLLLLPDADKAGRAGAHLAEQAYAAPGRVVETRMPWFGFNDWNNVLRRLAANGDRNLADAA